MFAGFELYIPKKLEEGLWLVSCCWKKALNAETFFAEPRRVPLDQLPASIQTELREYSSRVPPDPFVPEKVVRAISKGCAMVIGRQTPEGRVKLTRMKHKGGWWTEDDKFEKPVIAPEDAAAVVDAIRKLA